MTLRATALSPGVMSSVFDFEVVSAVWIFAGRDRRVRAVREPVGPRLHLLRGEVQPPAFDALGRDAAPVDELRMLRDRVEADRVGREGRVALVILNVGVTGDVDVTRAVVVGVVADQNAVFIEDVDVTVEIERLARAAVAGQHVAEHGVVVGSERLAR